MTVAGAGENVGCGNGFLKSPRKDEQAAAAEAANASCEALDDSDEWREESMSDDDGDVGAVVGAEDNGVDRGAELLPEVRELVLTSEELPVSMRKLRRQFFGFLALLDDPASEFDGRVFEKSASECEFDI